MSYYIGVDVGTGSARSCLINEAGEILAVKVQDIQLWEPQTHYYEQSTTDIWNAICTTVKQCLKAIEPAVDVAHIKGIGFDATCSLAVFSVDEDAPVPVTGPGFKNDGNDRNVILWMDHRPIQEAKDMNATNHKLLRYVGGSMSPEMEISKVLWLKNNMSPEMFANCKFYDLADALTHMATGQESRSLCSVVCKQGYIPVGLDGSVKGWQEDFLSKVGLGDLSQDDYSRIGGVEKNGAYLTAGELVGRLSEKAANELGLVPGIAVGSGVIDAYAGWIGSVGANAQFDSTGENADQVSKAFTRLAVVAGTSTCHLAMSSDSHFVDGVWGPYRDVLIPDYWLAEGGQSATGQLIRHVIETHPSYTEAKDIAQSVGKSIFDYLNTHLEKLAVSQGVPHISWLGRHLFFYGDLYGNRSPVADAAMRGSITGLSSDKSVDNLALMYYGALEFIALQTKHIIDRMNSSGHSIQSMFMSGSLCKNSILMDLISTACNMPVVIPEYVDAAVVHGAAMLGVRAAGISAGQNETLWSIMTRMTKSGAEVHPSQIDGFKRLLDAKYKVFLEQCEQQQVWRTQIDQAIHESAWK